MYFNIENLKMGGRYLQILGDFIIKEEICNLSCDYCLAEGSTLKDKHFFKRVDGKLNYRLDQIDALVYEDGYRLKEEVDQGLKLYYEKFDAPIIKFSGGEVLLIKNLARLLQAQSKYYEVVQVLTNGTLFNDQLTDELAGIPNINIQFSLDGHTLEMNYHRVKSEGMNKKLLDNMDLLVSKGIKTEAYCVVSNRNIDSLPDFIEYLLRRYGNKVHLILFPVRQGAAKTFMPDPENLNGFKYILDKYPEYQEILPPYAYLEEMYDYLTTRKRKSRCFVPLIMFQNFDDGLITPCPNCWTVGLGNLLEDTGKVIAKIGSERIYHLMTNNPPIAPFCTKCFADYHLFNLYFNGAITLDEMGRTRPLLSGVKVKSRLAELKKILNENICEAEDL